jgi:TetR/AcrR family transcriptional repressor of nem operon
VEAEAMAGDTREKILRTAARLIVQRGYTAASVSRIAKESGIGKATVYHHFPDKRAIALALLERSGGRVREVIASVRPESDPRRRIEAIASVAVGLRGESFDLFQVIRREVPESRNALHAQLGSFFTAYRKQMQEAIAEGVRRKIFRPVDPRQAAQTLLSMVAGLFVQAYLSGGRFSEPDRTMKAMLEIFFRGIDIR